MIVETGQGTVSDETGHFVFKEIPAGDYTLRVQMLGYTTEEKKVTVSNEYATDVHIALIEEGGTSSIWNHPRQILPNRPNILSIAVD